MAIEILSRASAKAIGSTRYHTGKPCKHGHIADRRTINGICIECLKSIETRCRDRHPDKFRAKWKKASAKARAENPDRIRKNNNKWARSNPAKVKSRKDRWRSNNPDRVKELDKAWRDANPEKIKKKNRDYKTANAERLSPIAIERTKKWRADNPAKVLENARKSSHTRRARQYKAGGSYTNEQLRDLIEKQKWKCAGHACGISLRKSKELDHIVPIARGGSNDIANLQYLCPPCNRKKNAKDPIAWAQMNGFLL